MSTVTAPVGAMLLEPGPVRSAGNVSTPDANPPTAEFSVSKRNVSTSETVTLDASASSDNGTITDYEWTFTTEGTTKNGTVVTHTPNSTGTHVVELTVVDDQGLANSTSKSITVTENDSAATNDSALSLNDTVSGTLDEGSATFGGGKGRIEKYSIASERGAVVNLTGTAPDHVSFYLVHDGEFVGQAYRTGPRTIRGAVLAGRDLELWVAGNDDKIPASYQVSLTRTGTIPLNISQISDGQTKRSVLGGSDPVKEVYSEEYSNKGHYETVSFQGVAGDVVNITSVSSNKPISLIMELRGPSGDVIASSDRFSELDIERATLPSTGTYTVEVQEDALSDDLNKYTLTLETVDTNRTNNPTAERNPPTAAFSVSTKNVSVSETVTLDASASSDNGTITDYEWTFTNESTTKNGTVVTHTPNSTGTHVVELTVVDDQGLANSTSKTITVTSDKSVGGTDLRSISYNQTRAGQIESSDPMDPDGYHVEPVTFQSEDGDIVNISTDSKKAIGLKVVQGTLDGGATQVEGGFRDFVSDPALSNLSLAGDTHQIWVRTYDGNVPTNYNLTLQLDADNAVNGTNGTTRGPPAAFSVSPENGTAGQPIRFNATNRTSASIESYEWDFGDGTVSTGRTVTHTYASNGTYNVTLTVTDGQSRTNSTERTVEIEPPLERLIVDDDGGQTVDYERLVPALENASDTATIIVRPGTYTGEIRSNPVGSAAKLKDPGLTVAKNVTLRAPNGATLGGGDEFDAARAGIKVRGGASPTIHGFTITGYQVGVDVFSDAERELILKNLTVRGADKGIEVALFGGTLRVTGSTFADLNYGLDAGGVAADVRVMDVDIDRAETYPIYARNASGNWTVSDVSVSEAGRLEAAGATGDWTLRDVTLDGTEGLGADDTEGDWLLRATEIRNGSFSGIAAARSTGDWQLRNVSISDHALGISAGGQSNNATGDWTITNSSFRLNEGGGVVATHTPGDWTLRDVMVTSNGGSGVHATGANGTWTVQRVTAVANDGGILAESTRGSWRLTDTLVELNNGDGLRLDGSKGTVHVQNGTFVDNTGDGISVAGITGGLWITNTSLADNDGSGLDMADVTPESAPTPGPGTVAPPGNTPPDWLLTDTVVTDNDGSGIDADHMTGRAVFRNLTLTDNGGDGITVEDVQQTWTLAATNVTGNSGDGIDANSTAGDWTVEETNVTGNRVGIDAGHTTGQWTVTDGRLERNRIGIRATDATDSWTIRASSLSDGERGLVANRSGGDWRLENVRISSNTQVGVEAISTAGDWRIRRSNVSRNGLGIDASDTRGAWDIHWSRIESNGVDIAAGGASPEGNARRNYWGPNGDADADCLGNVTCQNPLAAPPVGFQTGLDVRLIDGTTGDSLAGSTVYLLSASSVPEVLRYDELERLGPTSPQGTLRKATGGTAGRVVFNGLEERTYCLLVVPPGDSPRNVQSRCVPVVEDVLTDQRFVLDDTGVTSKSTTDWNQFQADPQNTGYVPTRGPRTGVVKKWTFDLGEGEGSIGSPIVYNDTVYVATSGSGKLYALDADSGAVEWTVETGGETNGPAAKSGTVYFRSGTTLYALDAETGREQWSSSIKNGKGAFQRASVTVADGKVIVPVTRGDGKGGYVAYDTDDGDLVWDQRFQSDRITETLQVGIVYTRATPAVSDGLIYGGATANAGALKPVSVASSPSKGGGFNRFASPAGATIDVGGTKVAKKAKQFQTLIAMEGRTGDYVWSQGANTVSGAPTVEDGVVYAPIKTRGKAQLSAFDDKTGDRVKGIGASGNIVRTNGPEGDNQVVSSPAVNGSRLYFGDGGKYVALSPDNESAFSKIHVRDDAYGETTWNLSTVGAHVASPALTKQTAYTVATSTPIGSKLIAVDKETGDPLWEYRIDDRTVQASPAVADQTVFLATSSRSTKTDRVIALSGWTESVAAGSSEYSAHDGHVSYLPPGDRYGPTSDDALTGYIMTDPHVETINGETLFYRTATFAGEAGETVSISMKFLPTRTHTLDELVSGRLVLLGPDGNRLASDEMDDDEPTARIPDRTLPESGLYTVVVASDAPNPAGLQYGLSVQSPAVTQTDTQREGQRVEVSVENADPGQRVRTDIPPAVSPRVKRVSVTLADDLGQGTFEIETTTSRPPGTPGPPNAAEPVYLQVDHPNVPDRAIGSGTITLELPKSEVDDPSNVTVYRNVGGTWQSVSTTVLKSVDDTYRFEVRTPGYSTFAVVTGQSRIEIDAPTGSDGDATDGSDTARPADTSGENGGSTDQDHGSGDGEDDGSGAGAGGEGESGDQEAGHLQKRFSFTQTAYLERVTFATGEVASVDASVVSDPSATTIDAIATQVVGSPGADAGNGTIDVVAMVDISPTWEGKPGSPATVEFEVPRDILDEPTNAFLAHSTDDGWERIDTSVQNASGRTVTILGEVESFSRFALVEADQTKTPNRVVNATQTQTEKPTPTPGTKPAAETPHSSPAETTATTTPDSQAETTTAQATPTNREASGFPTVPVIVIIAFTGAVITLLVIRRRTAP